MNTIQKKIMSDHSDFIDSVIKSGDTEENFDLDKTILLINKEFIGDEIPMVRDTPPDETMKIFKSVQVEHDENGPFVMVQDPDSVKSAFQRIKDYFLNLQ